MSFPACADMEESTLNQTLESLESDFALKADVFYIAYFPEDLVFIPA